MILKASSLRFGAYGKSQGSFPSFPIPLPLQTAAMTRTGFFCSSSQLVSIASSSQSHKHEERSRDHALRRDLRLCAGTIYWGLDSITAHRAGAAYWTQCASTIGLLAFFGNVTREVLFSIIHNNPRKPAQARRYVLSTKRKWESRARYM